MTASEPQPCCSKDVQKVKKALDFEAPVERVPPVVEKDLRDTSKLGFTESLMMTMEVGERTKGKKRGEGSVKEDGGGYKEHRSVVGDKSFYRSRRRKRYLSEDDDGERTGWAHEWMFGWVHEMVHEWVDELMHG